MTYFTGSTSNTSTPAKDFMEITLHPNLLTAGFTYVEEVLGPTTNTTRIYKSASASNGVGDWYLIVNRLADTSTQVLFGVCEDYDAVGHLAKKWAPISVIAGQTLPADRSHYTTAGTAPNSAVYNNWNIATALSAHAYVLSLHPKRIVVATKVVSAESSVYVGLYDPVLPALANHFPLCVSAQGNSSNIANSSFTREPGTGTSVATSNGRGTFTDVKTVLPAQSASTTPITAEVQQVDGYQGKPTLGRVYMPASQSKAGTRGLAIGLYAASNAFAWGDIANTDWAGTTVTATCIDTYHFSGAGSLRLVDQAY
jgi:hypothetical protein